MQITLNIPNEWLAVIWDDSWKDREESGIAERLLGVIERRAAEARTMSRKYTSADAIVAQFLKSKAAENNEA